MIKVNVENVKGILVTTSNRVAEELGVRHDNLLSKIDEYIEKFNSSESSGQFDTMQNFIKQINLIRLKLQGNSI